MLGIWAGCSTADREFDLHSFSTSIDQHLIARYYQDEAFQLRRQAEEFDARAEMYQRMFGLESDWVTGARLLAQSYRLAAEDRERLAQEHLQAAPDVRPAASQRPRASLERTP
jgi:hypothetical protein